MRFNFASEEENGGLLPDFSKGAAAEEEATPAPPAEGESEPAAAADENSLTSGEGFPAAEGAEGAAAAGEEGGEDAEGSQERPSRPRTPQLIRVMVPKTISQLHVTAGFLPEELASCR